MGIIVNSAGIPIHKTMNPGNVLTNIYVVPLGKRARIGITICNRNGNNKTFRVAISPLGVAIIDSHYIYYDKPLNVAETLETEKFYELFTGDIVRVQGSTTDISFTLNGIEY